jgi:hypothetical protein
VPRADRPPRRNILRRAIVVGGSVILVAAVVVVWLQANSSPPSAGAGIPLGSTAPAIALPATTGGTLSLDRLRGSKVVVYFYEDSG